MNLAWNRHYCVIIRHKYTNEHKEIIRRSQNPVVPEGWEIVCVAGFIDRA